MKTLIQVIALDFPSVYLLPQPPSVQSTSRLKVSVGDLYIQENCLFPWSQPLCVTAISPILVCTGQDRSHMLGERPAEAATRRSGEREWRAPGEAEGCRGYFSLDLLASTSLMTHFLLVVFLVQRACRAHVRAGSTPTPPRRNWRRSVRSTRLGSSSSRKKMT